MSKEWLQNYPQGVSDTIALDRYSSLVELLDESVKRYAKFDSYENMEKNLSYQELGELSEQFAAYLQKVLGLKKGDRLAVQMPNLLQYPVVLFGALKAGVIIVNTNPLYTPREMKHQFKDSGAKAIVILENFAHHLKEVLEHTSIETVIVTAIGDMLSFPKRHLVNAVVRHIKKMVPSYEGIETVSFRDCLSWGAAHDFEAVEISKSDTVALQYTGGTTGVSKGVVLSHQNVLANVLQVASYLGPVVTKADEGEQEVIVTPLPLYHIFSFTLNCITMLNYGAKNVLITNPRDFPAFIKTLSKCKGTIMTGVNTLYNALLNHKDIKQADFSRMKLSIGGGMAVQKFVSDKWEELTGRAILEGYGLTETSPVLCVNPVNGKQRVGTIGLPVPMTEVKICDQEGQELSKGESGELWARGPQVMKEYWQRPEETKKVLTTDGWFKTGDIAMELEGGFFKIVDRIKDMILVSGFNVYPNEIEDVITLHEKVLEVAAVGHPSESSGEIVKVYVVKKEDSLTKEELIEFCRKNLTGYKIPKIVEFRKELPKTNVGKILRRALREESIEKKTLQQSSVA